MLAGALLITAVVVAAGPRMWRVANAHDQVPVELPEFQPLSQRTIVYDVYGTVIAVFEREKTEPIKLSQVPPEVIQAVLAVEDNEFYVHHGVNLRSFARALLSNFSSDAPRQGASTITQQVAKNEFLAGLPRDGRYKGLQAHYALMLEKQMTKDQILERYLNTIFFGNNAYGLQAAAEVYFGKNVEDLTMIEGAFLAGLVRSPSGYDPINKPERSRARFKQVTQRLADVGLLTPDDADRLGDEYVLPERVRTTPTLTTRPTYYSEALRLYLLEKSNLLGATEQERANLLYRGGLRIHTTLDPFLQAYAEAARNVLPATAQGFDASIVSLDTKTGAIRAMVGGRGLRPREPAGEVNMALVPRQTGSSIKLFILASAFQAGAEPTDLLDGAKPCTLPIPDDPNAPPFVIEEGASGFLGPLNQLTWLSINCAFSRLAQIVGLNRVVDTTYRMARSPYLYQGQAPEDRDPIQPYASYATGANEMAPIDMAAGMQTLANQGLHQEPYYVDYIDRADGSRLYTQASAGVQVLDPGVALTTIDTLKGVLTRGTARRALASFPRPAAGKTGTQEDNTNSWFVGATPELTTAVWVGDPKGYTPMVNVPEFVADGVRKVQGGTYPARIWGAFMEPALGNLPVSDWPSPPPATRRPVRLYLPGNECLARLVSGTLPPLPGVSTTTSTTTPPTTDATGATGPTVITEPKKAVLEQIPSGTTIAPDVLDPRAPLPSVDIKTVVYTCDRPPPNVVIQPKKAK